MGRNMVGMIRPGRCTSGTSSSSSSLSEGGGGTALLMLGERRRLGCEMLLGEGEAGMERETSRGETVPETSADDASSSPPDNASPSSSIKNGSGTSGSTKTIGGRLASMGSEGGVVWRGVGKSEVSALSA